MSAAAAAHLLTRHTHRRRGAPPLTFLGELGLERGRVHEVCGSARRTLAVQIAGRLTGAVMWIAPSWTAGRLNPEGMLPFVSPSRFLFVSPRRPEDVLWSMEEALRSGAVPFVVADLPGPPGLTSVRRLHLAAEAGAEAGEAPLGLLLTPGEGGAPGGESRWAMAGDHGTEDRMAWRLDRRRARTAPENRWGVGLGKDGLTLAGRSVPGEQPGQ